jgi:AP-1 complex subunit sigma 1/2
MAVHFSLLISRQGKVRLSKWYAPYNQTERARATREITHMVIGRPSKLCNFLDWRDQRVVYKRYASLYFIVVVDKTDNELITMEIIHHFVEVLDRFFGNVCELDLIFNFHKAYFILDEVLLNGEIQETSKKSILRVIQAQNTLQDNTHEHQFTT